MVNPVFDPMSEDLDVDFPAWHAEWKERNRRALVWREKTRIMLADLPSNPDDIAAWLELQGFKGRHEAMSCPIHHYLGENSSVTENRIAPLQAVRGFGGVYYTSSHSMGDISPPDNVAFFIARFDDGRYPNLCADEECKKCQK